MSAAAPAAAAAASSWSWADHACRTCLSRLVRREAPGGVPVFECGTCTVSSKGAPDGICGCGVLPPPVAARHAAGAPAGAPAARFRCLPNPARSVTDPASIVVRWEALPA